jgi:hypothetical protein
MAILATAAGCRPSPIYVPAVQVQLAVQPAEVRPGDTVRIAVMVANPGADTVALEFGEECPVTFSMLDETDRVIPITHETAGCLAAEQERVVLAPGTTWRAEGQWHVPAGAEIPAGPYVVSAALGDHDSVAHGKREYKMGSGAGRVPIRVLPARRAMR